MRESMDVVVVPDFLGPGARIQEAELLFFLASWLENAGEARRFPLHLACIGVPSDAACHLAEQAGASITLHQPIGIVPGHFTGNKLRGFEIEPRASRLLLIDVDTLILSDLSGLSSLGDGIWIAPDDAPSVSEADWQMIHQALDVPQPDYRLDCTLLEMDQPRWPRKMQRSWVESTELPVHSPYYNAGVIVAPWECGLRQLWETNIRRIRTLIADRAKPPRWAKADQPALAVTLEVLRRQGLPLSRLSDEYHTRWRHFYAGRPTPEQIKILHCTGFLHARDKGGAGRTEMADAMHFYFESKLWHRYLRLLAGDALRGRPIRGLLQYRQAMALCRKLGTVLDRLFERYVRPALNYTATASHASNWQEPVLDHVV